MINRNFVRMCLDDGGMIKPLIIPSNRTGGTGLMNPSIYIDNGKIIGVVRHTNYTLYHSEKKKFDHPWGTLTYVHPENDRNLRTWNWYIELNDKLDITRYTQIDTSKFDTYTPKWQFIGLEDARIFRWDGNLYCSGVRRDTTDDGQGRIELSKLEFHGPTVVETSRLRIDIPTNTESYCEKNWMPVLNKPYHYVKWTNPTEVVKVDIDTGKSTIVTLDETKIEPSLKSRDIRGGSQILPYKDGYIALTHEVELYNLNTNKKNAEYFHRFIIWDKDWNMIKWSPEFHFMNADVEFSIGMAEYNGDFLITFGFQDNAAFVLRAKKETIERFIYG